MVMCNKFRRKTNKENIGTLHACLFSSFCIWCYMNFVLILNWKYLNAHNFYEQVTSDFYSKAALQRRNFC